MPLGIIPTCTGNTQSGRLTSKFKWDHPRTCGEHSTVTISPLLSVGSSPHVRGAQRHHRSRSRHPGIIPACAGSTLDKQNVPSEGRDHPRMCREHPWLASSSTASMGSSPHVRGALRRIVPYLDSRGIIPACAGSTTLILLSTCKRRDHPRMCGEHFLVREMDTKHSGSSPHVRGAP